MAPSGEPTPDVGRAVRETVTRHVNRPAGEVTALGGAEERRVYRVDTGDGPVVVKVLGRTGLRAAGCGYAVAALRDAGIPTPRLLAVDRSGTHFPTPVAIYECAPGVPASRWQLEQHPTASEMGAMLRDLGGYVRRMHDIETPGGFGKLTDRGVGTSRSWPNALFNKRQRARSGEKLRTLDIGSLADAGVISGPIVAELEAVVDAAGPRLERPAPNLVHNDITLKNVLVDPTTGAVTAILDLHNALGGDPLFDLARFRYFYRGRGLLEPLLDGYGSEPHERADVFAFYVVVVTLEKLTWLRGREDRFPERAAGDLAYLRETLDELSAAV